MRKLQMIANSVIFTAKKYSPEILLGVGVVGVGVSTVLACKATLQVEGILDEYTELKEKVQDGIELHEEGEINYPIEVANKDLKVLKAQTAVSFVKLYAPSATLMTVSIGCILGAHRIMSKRNVALMAAYKVVEEAFTTYRGRVVKELGEAKDAHFMYGTETVIEEETIIDENGKKKKITKEKEELIPGAKLSGFARMFEAEQPDQVGGWTGSTQWSPVHDYNLSFLDAKEKHFNNKLVVKGFVTVNEVLEELGFETTVSGMVAGWKYKSSTGDGYISFRPRGIDGNWMVGQDGDVIVLDFNIDGVIFDQKEARKELS
ncbi:MAG: DUF6353 family protein [Gudongella sp.]|jgi:hypothetical protein|nr:DUF6353 family protein [Gudongella sp.]